MLIPSCGNSAAPLSKTQPEPNDFDVAHSASRALTTNQPSSAGARPEPESSSRASGTVASLSIGLRVDWSSPDPEHLLVAVTARDATARAAIDFLLASREPAIRFLTRRDVLGEDFSADRDEILSGPIVRGLMRGQKGDGSFGVHAYQKWG